MSAPPPMLLFCSVHQDLQLSDKLTYIFSALECICICEPWETLNPNP